MSDPKKICRDLLEKSNAVIPQAAMYEAVMLKADVVILKNRCPRGFRPFTERLERLLADNSRNN
jgi:hypothetical protein